MGRHEPQPAALGLRPGRRAARLRAARRRRPNTDEDLVPDRRHGGTGPSGARGSALDDGRVRRQHQRIPACGHGRLGGPAGDAGARGRSPEPAARRSFYHVGRQRVIKGSVCLVTGGAGTIGSTIVDQLVAAGAAEIRVLDNFVRGCKENLSGALSSGRVEVVEGDIRDIGLVNHATEGADLVFHQAAIRITQCAEEPRLALEVLADGTFNVLEAAAAAGVRKVVAASSASVYGLASEFPTTEGAAPWSNDTFYGAAKVFNEGMLRSFHAMHGLDYVALRYFNVYGPRMDVHGLYTEVLIRWMERIEAGEPPLVLGDGRQTMDFVFTTDIARANLLAAEADVTDAVFNIGSSTETSLLGLAEALLATMGSSLSVEFGPGRAVNGVTRRLASIDAARRQLGWTPEVDLEQGLGRLVDWWHEERRRA